MLVRLHSPHPGVGGASIPFPKSLRELAKGMDGKIDTIESAVALLNSAAQELVEKKHFFKAEVQNVEQYKYLIVILYDGNPKKYPVHSFKAIEYDDSQSKSMSYHKALVAENLINTYEEFHGPDYDAWSCGLGILPCPDDENESGVAIYCRGSRPPGKPDEITVNIYRGEHKVRLIYVENYGKEESP